MELLYAALLGIIEGLTEFLPVSSTGHLVIALPALGLHAEQPPWNVLLWMSQFAAILAVMVVFWRDLWRRTFCAPRAGWQHHILTKIGVAFVPTVIGGVLLDDYKDRLETMPAAVAVALIVGALGMWYVDRRFRRDVRQDVGDISLRQAFLIGTFQILAMWPGVSRSGATIFGGMALGLSPRAATEFTFYLAIPTMLGAFAKTLLDEGGALTGSHLGLLLVNAAVSFGVALVVIAWFLEYVKRHRFTVFAVYRVVLGIAVLAAWQAGWVQ